jgi:hypothetical protein
MKVICDGSLENPMILKLSNSSVQYYNFRLLGPVVQKLVNFNPGLALTLG